MAVLDADLREDGGRRGESGRQGRPHLPRLEKVHGRLHTTISLKTHLKEPTTSAVTPCRAETHAQAAEEAWICPRRGYAPIRSTISCASSSSSPIAIGRSSSARTSVPCRKVFGRSSTRLASPGCACCGLSATRTGSFRPAHGHPGRS